MIDFFTVPTLQRKDTASLVVDSQSNKESRSRSGVQQIEEEDLFLDFLPFGGLPTSNQADGAGLPGSPLSWEVVHFRGWEMCRGRRWKEILFSPLSPAALLVCL